MDILLIQPSQGEFVKKRIFQPGVEVPLNLACLSSYLDRENISNAILDMRVSESPQAELEENLREMKPKVVGISAYTSEANNSKRVAKTVKEFDDSIATVVGGHHGTSLLGEFLQESPNFDFLVHGEGEMTFSELFRCLDNGNNYHDIKGIVFRKEGECIVTPRRDLISNLDDLPLPSRDKLDLDKYAPTAGTGNYMQLPTTGIMASRGCPYGCFYCSKAVWGTTIRFRSPESVIAEIEHCIDKYGIKDFRFYDDALTLPKFGMEHFCQIIADKKLKITWNCYSRVNHINEEKLRMMKNAGCYHIKYGIEFGTERILKLTNKGATMAMSRSAVMLTKKVGLECKGNFMLGVPGETIEECKKTIEFAKELSPDLASFYPFDLIPGCEFYKRKQAGDKTIDDALPKEVAQQLSDRAYLAFYFRPRYIAQRLMTLLKNPKREMVQLVNGLSMITVFFFRKNIAKISNLWSK